MKINGLPNWEVDHRPTLLHFQRGILCQRLCYTMYKLFGLWGLERYKRSKLNTVHIAHLQNLKYREDPYKKGEKAHSMFYKIQALEFQQIRTGNTNR